MQWVILSNEWHKSNIMAAPKGNTFFKFVQKPTGRPKKYTPNSLWKKAQQYFEWVVKNPLYEQKAFANGKTKNLPKMRAMTELAFCEFAGIDRTTFNEYKSGRENYKEFPHITEKISNIIYLQKFEGAAADLFNANLIYRDLGLKEKTEVSGPNGTLLTSQLILSKEEMKLYYEALERDI
jgi:hypothetical protein